MRCGSYTSAASSCRRRCRRGAAPWAAIVGLEARAIEDVCREAQGGDGEDSYCAPANFNGAGQVVIAGERPGVERAMALAKAKGAKLVKQLPVSAPFHCRLMAPAAERLTLELERVAVAEPGIPVVSNVEATPYREAARVKELLVRQVTAPVRWEESVQALAAAGITQAVELGPGKVLSGLVKRITPVHHDGQHRGAGAHHRGDACAGAGPSLFSRKSRCWISVSHS